MLKQDVDQQVVTRATTGSGQRSGEYEARLQVPVIAADERRLDLHETTEIDRVEPR